MVEPPCSNVRVIIANFSGEPISRVFTVGHRPTHDKTNKMAYAPSEDSDQPGHPPSLIRVFTVRMKKALVLWSLTTH